MPKPNERPSTSTETKVNRVWIELERDGDALVNEARAALVSRMLVRLGCEASPEPIWWNERARRYCYNKFGHGGFVELSDDGEWFNLDYLGSADPKVETHSAIRLLKARLDAVQALPPNELKLKRGLTAALSTVLMHLEG